MTRNEFIQGGERTDKGAQNINGERIVSSINDFGRTGKTHAKECD